MLLQPPIKKQHMFRSSLVRLLKIKTMLGKIVKAVLLLAALAVGANAVIVVVGKRSSKLEVFKVCIHCM